MEAQKKAMPQNDDEARLLWLGQQTQLNYITPGVGEQNLSQSFRMACQQWAELAAQPHRFIPTILA